jgi:hypothetical protein
VDAGGQQHLINRKKRAPNLSLVIKAAGIAGMDDRQPVLQRLLRPCRSCRGDHQRADGDRAGSFANVVCCGSTPRPYRSIVSLVLPVPAATI